VREPSGERTAEVLRADVLVVGGGLAGAIAALAARASGARVALARRGPGATALSSGAIGVATDLWAPPAAPFSSRLDAFSAARRIAASRPEHPYAVVRAGLEQLEEAVAFAAAELSSVLAPPGPRPLVLATPYGVAVECALAQRTMVSGDLASVRGTVAVVGFRGHLGFDALLVAGGLARRLGERELEQLGLVSAEFARRFRAGVLEGASEAARRVLEPVLLQYGVD
jgi:glycerol-3-phosphate dehydrogenase subunit B